MRPFIQFCENSYDMNYRDYPCGGFTKDYCGVFPDSAGAELIPYSAPIQQTPVRERVNSALKLNLFIFGGL